MPGYKDHTGFGKNINNIPVIMLVHHVQLCLGIPSWKSWGKDVEGV